MKRIIIFLIRKRLGLKKEQPFRFSNQKLKEEYYWFTGDKVMKRNIHGEIEESTVSLNWLLDDKCEIDKTIPNRFRKIEHGELEKLLKDAIDRLNAKGEE